MEKPYLHTANLSSTRNATQHSTLLPYFSLNKVIRLVFGRCFATEVVLLF